MIDIASQHFIWGPFTWRGGCERAAWAGGRGGCTVGGKWGRFWRWPTQERPWRRPEDAAAWSDSAAPRCPLRSWGTCLVTHRNSLELTNRSFMLMTGAIAHFHLWLLLWRLVAICLIHFKSLFKRRLWAWWPQRHTNDNEKTFISMAEDVQQLMCVALSINKLPSTSVFQYIHLQKWKLKSTNKTWCESSPFAGWL